MVVNKEEQTPPHIENHSAISRSLRLHLDVAITSHSRGVADNVTDTSAASMSVWYENDTLPANTLEEAQEKTRVRFAFWIMAAVNVSPLTCTHTRQMKRD